CGGGVDVVRRTTCPATSAAPTAATATTSATAPIPLPPKKHRYATQTSNAATTFTSNTCDEQEYDEYYPQQYEQPQQPQQSQQSHRHTSSRSATSGKHQRAATFDVSDSRDYELQRLGNRRSHAANSKHRSGSNDTRIERAHHDRERSRSDHRISSYACDDMLVNGNVQPRQQRREKTFKV
ncbi:uncharacterized protein LOC119666212, partial [Teleopsis dalmanni]|uniref:uncharacterized protein LOC119666212 n=1 Tax=Teleopsis dalmanni TaxID=139649 RepID=UPI0018CF9338